MAIWATIWATCDTARLVGRKPGGPADRGAGVLDAVAGLARCPKRWRAAVAPSYGTRRCPPSRAACRPDASDDAASEVPLAPANREAAVVRFYVACGHLPVATMHAFVLMPV